MGKRSKKKVMSSKANTAIISFGIVFVVCIVAVMTYLYTYVNNWDSKVYPGVTIANINLGGKSKDEIEKIVKNEYVDKVLRKKIIISAKEQEYIIDYSSLDIEHNLDRMVKKIFNYGKYENVFKKYSMLKNKNNNKFDVDFSFDIEKVQPVIEEIKTKVNKNPINPKLKRENGKFVMLKGTDGSIVNEEELKSMIASKLNSDLTELNVKITVPIESVSPKATKEDLDKIDTKISSFKTTHGYNTNRTENIRLSTEAINGLVLLPGDEFDFNEVVGERTAERGYKGAHEIVKDAFVEGIGGGICQTSSTLYCAMLRANVNATVRGSHTIASSYVDIGQDATVSWGGPDYKFINTLEYPIYIEGYADSTSVVFNVYSNSELAKYTYKVYSGDKKVIPAKNIVIEDPTMYEGTTSVVKGSFEGHSAIVYRETYENNKLLKKEKLYDAKIVPVNGTIKKGTKKKTA